MKRINKQTRWTSGQRIIVALLILAPAAARAQTPKEEIAANWILATSNHAVYPGPLQTALTPAPEGYAPFYISHYGRHGSRYLCRDNEYTEPLLILSRADSLGKLTEKGRDVLRRVRLMDNERYLRTGELTFIGAEQHRGIARRMYERFPEVFAGSVHVDARSTIVIRCILSMVNEVLELKGLNPDLQISTDASEHDMPYMNYQDHELWAHRMPNSVRAIYDEWVNEHVDPMPLMRRLFNDENYVRDNINARRLFNRITRLADIVQDSEIHHQFNLYDIFTFDDIYHRWQQDNIDWYINYAHCPLNGATQPFSQRYLLENIITVADSCIRLDHPGATLRFGHETMVMPLTCLMGLNGFDLQTVAIDSLEEKGWVNYRVFPMAANIQLVFYKQARQTPADDSHTAKDTASADDVLVKVLLNENEATLPAAIQPVSGPYYRWSDVRRYYLNKIATYHGYNK